mgnify:CR=1 FL=1
MPQKLEPKNFAGLNVLIVENQPPILGLMRDYFALAGVKKIYEAPNGQDAIALIQGGGAPDINFILCDWNMPIMTGLEFLKLVREFNPDIPFLMMSGRGDKESIREAKEAGVSGYIPKPFNPLQLEAKLDVLLNPYGDAAVSVA